MSIVAELGDKIAALTPGPDGTARELRLLMEERFGIVAPGGSAPPPPQEEVQLVPAEPTEFTVTLTGFANNEAKLRVIKVVREITGVSLMDAKNGVESKNMKLREGADKAAAADIKKRIEEAGGEVKVEGT